VYISGKEVSHKVKVKFHLRIREFVQIRQKRGDTVKKFLLLLFALLLIFSVIFIGCKTTTTTKPLTTAATAAKTTAPTTAPGVFTVAPATATPTATKAAPAGKSGGVITLTETESGIGSIGIPWRYAGLSGRQANPMHETLIARYPLTDEMIPQLAESWEWSNNYMTITFHLRHGVKFQDGTDFNAKAVQWNFEQQTAAKITGTEVIKNTEVLDDYTFRVNLTTFQNTWIRKITGDVNGAYLGIQISPTAVGKSGVEALDWNPVGTGTGPFKFKTFKRDQYLDYTRNDDYWGGKPLLDGLRIAFINDAVAAQLGFESGTQDSFSAIGRDYQLRHDLAPKGFQVVDTIGLAYHFVPSVRGTNNPWANVKVRQAFDYAVDKATVVKTAFYGNAIALYKNATPQQYGYDPNFVGRRYDPAKAKALLAEAGYPNGFKTTLYCGTHLADQSTNLVQSYMKAVGMDTTLDLHTPSKWVDYETNGWDNGLMYSPQGSGCFGLFLERYYITPQAPNWNRGIYWDAMYRPKEFNDMILKYLTIGDVEQEKKYAVEVQQWMFDNAPSLQAWIHSGAIILQPYVRNYTGPKGVRNDQNFWYTGCWLDK
jgi:peptide/nickel transport system substrate-binding protein